MASNRGWIVDALLEIGHLEAALSHIDEFAIAKSEYEELGKKIYATRKLAMEDVFKEAKDPGMWCIIKHLSTAYVMSEEICHAKEYESEKEIIMNTVGDCLAEATEIALGLEKTECLRCLSERSGK